MRVRFLDREESVQRGVWCVAVGGSMLLAACAAVETSRASAVGGGVPRGVSRVDARLYRGARPDAEGLRRLRALGIKTIVTLSEDAAALEAERQMAAVEGIDVVSIPVSLEREPTDEEVLLFLGTVLAPQRQPLYLHCDDGRDRTSTMVALYRVVVGGWEIKVAYEEAKALGFRPYYGDAVLHRFIHQLKDHPQYFEWARELATPLDEGGAS